MNKLLTKLQNLACSAVEAVKQCGIAYWNKGVKRYHAACDWLCRQLKKALRTV